MSKIKGIPIGAGFILTEENDYFKIQSVSKNFSMRVNNTLPLYVACKESVSNPDFRPTLQDMVTMCYSPATIQFNQERYKKYVEFLSGFMDDMKGKEATDQEHADALQQVKEEYEMREKLKKEMESPD